MKIGAHLVATIDAGLVALGVVVLQVAGPPAVDMSANGFARRGVGSWEGEGTHEGFLLVEDGGVGAAEGGFEVEALETAGESAFDVVEGGELVAAGMCCGGHAGTGDADGYFGEAVGV